MDNPERGISPTKPPPTASALEGSVNDVDSLGARIVQGSLLALWIVALLFLALFACSGRASELLLDFSTRMFSPSNVFFIEPCASPDLLLQGYLNGRGNPPPIATVLALQRHLIMVPLDALFLPVPCDVNGTPGRFAVEPTRPTAARHAPERC